MHPDKVPPVRGAVGRPRFRPASLVADRGYDHDTHRGLVRKRASDPSSPIVRQLTAPGSGACAGSLSAPSPGCTTSSGCSFATTVAPRSTRLSSRSAAASSASGGSGDHFEWASALSYYPQRLAASGSGRRCNNDGVSCALDDGEYLRPFLLRYLKLVERLVEVVDEGAPLLRSNQEIRMGLFH
jgi:hypothetical protein